MIEAFRVLHEIHKLFDRAAAQLEGDIGTSLCQGCGSCCSVNTPTWMTIEALNAVSVMVGLPAYRQAVSIAEGWLLDRENLKLFAGNPTGFMSQQLHEEWTQVTMSPCPFMVQKRCLIYEARPLTCRAYGVTRTPGGSCQRHVGKGETLTQRRWASGQFIKEVVDEFKADLRERNPYWVHRGQVPTLLYRSAEEKKLRQYIKENRIASAKLVGGFDADNEIMWQPQKNALQAGVDPDLVAAGITRRPGLN